jgi:hypothetical protein
LVGTFPKATGFRNRTKHRVTLPPIAEIMKNILIILISLGFGFSCTTPLKNQEKEIEIDNSEKDIKEDCIFDQKTQTDEFIKGINEFNNYTWDSVTNTATILMPNGDTILAFRGGCNHFGISGTILSENDSNSIENQEYWLKQSLWLSEKIMPESDFLQLTKMVEEKTYNYQLNTNLLTIGFNGHNYTEWYLRVEKKNKNAEMEIGYYFD